MDQSSHPLSRDLAELGEALEGLGERLLVAASQLHHPGSFPDPGLMAEVEGRRGEFAALREGARGEAQSLGVAAPPPEELDSVQGLARLLEAISAESARREGAGAARLRARGVLEGVLGLVYRGPTPHPAFLECQASARALNDALAAEGDGPEPSADVRSLAEGEHPLAGLLHLVHHRDELGDDDWADTYDRVAAAFGKALAAAVAMSRVGPPPSEGPGAGADGHHADAPGLSSNGLATTHAEGR